MKDRRVCSSCNIENYKANNPIKYAYFTLRNNAKRRGKEFNITFEYFKKFCKKHEYIQKKGITKTGLHIDRIKEDKGYIKGNLQVLTNSENVKKIRRHEAGIYKVVIISK